MSEDKSIEVIKLEELTEIQTLLTRCLKCLKLDDAAILFIMLALKNEDAQGAMAL